jgi:hypothetical protein
MPLLFFQSQANNLCSKCTILVVLVLQEGAWKLEGLFVVVGSPHINCQHSIVLGLSSCFLQNLVSCAIHIRDICKVRKRQHQYPEFGHTQGETQKILQKSTLAFKGGGGETQKTINFDSS